jgi:hypothetical protein
MGRDREPRCSLYAGLQPGTRRRPGRAGSGHAEAGTREGLRTGAREARAPGGRTGRQHRRPPPRPACARGAPGWSPPARPSRRARTTWPPARATPSTRHRRARDASLHERSLAHRSRVLQPGRRAACGRRARRGRAAHCARSARVSQAPWQAHRARAPAPTLRARARAPGGRARGRAVAAREAAMDALYSACTLSPATARAASFADTHAALALCARRRARSATLIVQRRVTRAVSA